MLEELMTNPYAWAALSLCTIISLPIGIWGMIQGNKYKEFSFAKASNSIVRGGKKLIPHLKFTYNNVEIDNLTVTKIALWNSGNEVINLADVVDGIGLAVTVPDDVEILSSEIIGVSDESNAFCIADGNGQKTELSFNYVDKSEGVVLQLCHTGFANDVSVSCKIKGGKPVKDSNPVVKGPRFISKLNPQKYIAVMGSIIAAVSTVVDVYLVASLFIPAWYAHAHTPIPMSFEGHIAFSIVFTVSSILLDHLSIKMVKQAFRLPIPLKLRQYMHE